MIKEHPHLCPRQSCPHYAKATVHPRSCYYEPQCWRGRVDVLVHALRLRLGRMIH